MYIVKNMHVLTCKNHRIPLYCTSLCVIIRQELINIVYCLETPYVNLKVSHQTDSCLNCYSNVKNYLLISSVFLWRYNYQNRKQQSNHAGFDFHGLGRGVWSNTDFISVDVVMWICKVMLISLSLQGLYTICLITY